MKRQEPRASGGDIPEEIARHYLEGKEAGRLASGRGELERVRTQSILGRFLPPAPATILDVGGAAGVYAIPLARQGYFVHLIDPVELHVTEARDAARAAGVSLAGLAVGDARRLDLGNESADAVLMLGPLYHLVDREERMRVLREARRVLKPHGVLIAAGISRFASLIDGVASGLLRDPVFRDIVARDIETGRHENPTSHPEYFTTAYFHRPEELRDEIGEAGFTGVQVLAVEGPVWSADGFESAWADPAQREALLSHLETVEGEPSIQGASAHVLVIGRRENAR